MIKAPFNFSFPLVDGEGFATPAFRDLLTDLALGMVPNRGVGSPEGVIEMPQGSLYVDTAGASGAILYVKKSTSIASDPRRGWVAV